jgi:hypothetical protein
MDRFIQTCEERIKRLEIIQNSAERLLTVYDQKAFHVFPDSLAQAFEALRISLSLVDSKKEVKLPEGE